MDRVIKAIPIQNIQAARLFPLIQVSRPDLDLCEIETAIQNAREAVICGTSGSPYGGLAFEVDRGYVIGFFTYGVGEDLLDGRTLFINHFVPMDVMGRYGTEDIMIAEAEALAIQLCCHALHLRVVRNTSNIYNDKSTLSTKLRQAGHRCDGVSFRKNVDPNDIAHGSDRAETNRSPLTV